MRASHATLVVLIALVPALLFSAPPRSYRYRTTKVTDGSTISGRVVFEGAAPKIMIPVNKDVKVCCKADKKERPSARIQVGEKGGVKHAVVYLTEVKKGKPFPKEEVLLNQKGCTFEPHISFVQMRKKIKIANGDPVLHNVHAYLGGRDVFNLALPSGTPPVAQAMRKAGVVELKCDAGHDWMSAYIFVVQHPYYVVTDEKGNFKIDNVPPGKYTLRVWHERWDTLPKSNTSKKTDGGVQLDVPVTVTAKSTQKIDFSLKPDGKITQLMAAPAAP